MGPLVSVIPGGEPVRQQVDNIIHQLEALNPCDNPLKTLDPGVELGPGRGVAGSWQNSRGGMRGTNESPEPGLGGCWRLVYASNDEDEVRIGRSGQVRDSRSLLLSRRETIYASFYSDGLFVWDE
jgi:hypothetical protein